MTRAASTTSVKPRPARPAKKRHHYVPVTYLEGFTGSGGRLQVYRCDAGGDPLSLAPNNIALENYYYSQMSPEGERDDHGLEDLFSAEVETHWPAARAAAREDRLTPAIWARLWVMLASLRARVPAVRELIETSLAAQVRMTVDRLDRSGKLPPMPPELQDVWSQIQVTIDPQKSLEFIPQFLQSANMLEPALGFEVLHNRTGRPFITSDNPVSWFDPHVPEARRRPYYVNRADLRAELIFPIDSRTLLRGTNALRRRHADRPTYRDITEEAVVRRLNRITAQFAYRLVFCEDRSSDRLVALYRDTSPVVRTDVRLLDHGDLLWMEMVFGRRPLLPKWRGARDADPFDRV